jgi:hypothetical protein
MSLLDILNGNNVPPGFMGDPVGTAQAIQRAIDQQVANLRAGVTPQNSPSIAQLGGPQNSDPYQQLQQQLFQQINSIPSYITPMSQLQQQAQAQVNSIYDPQIAALIGTMENQKESTKKSQNSAKNMYNSLAQDLASQIPGITSQMRQAQDEATNRYAQAAQQSQQDYSQQASQQQQILNQLGLQSAQQATSAQSAADQNYFKQQNQLSKNQTLDALQQQQNSDVGYQRNISDNSRMAGTNAVEDLQRQLDDFLNQGNVQLGTIQAEKSSQLGNVLQQLISADQRNAQSQRQNQIDNMLKLFNFQLDAQKASSAANRNNDIFKGTSGPAGAANYLAEALGGDRKNTASQILQLINDTMADPNVVSGHHPELDSQGNPMKDPITGKPITMTNTDQYIEDLLRSKMEQATGGYSTGDINSAINALLAYLGKLR